AAARCDAIPTRPAAPPALRWCVRTNPRRHEPATRGMRVPPGRKPTALRKYLLLPVRPFGVALLPHSAQYPRRKSGLARLSVRYDCWRFELGPASASFTIV